jgi:MFS family permease
MSTRTRSGRRDAGAAGVAVTLREAPVAVKALLAGVFVNKLGGFLQVFLVLFLTSRGFSAVQAGVALGAYGAGAVAGVLAGGWLTDRLGPRRTIVLSLAGSAVLLLAVLYLRQYPALLAAVAVVGAVAQAYRPASAALLTEMTPVHRQVMIFAIYRLALNLGTTAAPLIGAALVNISYTLLFWGDAVTTLGYAVIALVALRRVGGERGRPAPAASPAAPATGHPATGHPASGHPATARPATTRPTTGRRGGYREVLSDRRYVLFLLAMLANAAVYMQYVAALPLAVRDAGLGAGVYGALVALNGGIVIVCELLVTKVVQHWPARVVVMVGFTLLGGGLACYALPFGVAAFVVGTLIWSLAETIGGPTMFAYPGRAGPPALRGRYIGAAHAAFGLGSAIGPALGVAAWERIGASLWLCCGLVAALGLAAGWAGIRPAGAPTPAPEPAPEPEAVPEAEAEAVPEALAQAQAHAETAPVPVPVSVPVPA